jgi:hypothetical protein
MKRVKAKITQRPAMLAALTMMLMLMVSPMFGVSASKTAVGLSIPGSRIDAPLAIQAATSGCVGVSFSQPAGSPLGAGDAPRSVAVGDFNLDGKADLATANGLSDNVTILLGDGSGGFTEAPGSPLAAGDFPTSIAVGDFNSDGKADLAMANGNSDNVTILLGTGGGGFTQPANSPLGVGDLPDSVVVGDFNQDGKADLAVANSNSGNVTILLGNGNGGFTQPASSPVGVGTNPQSVVAGDFNRDGKADLAVANGNSDNVTILLGIGGGGFTQPASSPLGVGDSPRSIAVGDFNQDGKADLATANFSSSNVTILLGNGNGGFTQPANSPLGAGDAPLSVVVGDFNQDGKADLATANSTFDNVTILLGNGSGSFTEAAGSPLGVGDNPFSVATGDFNLDGKPDLATANFGSGNVTILLNTCDENVPPTIIATLLSRTAGSPSANSQIATVNDVEDAETLLTMTVNGGASATINGVTVSGISVNAAGAVNANVVAACQATTANFTLRVTDSGDLFAEATLTVAINPDNQPPTITCLANLNRSTDLGQCSAVATYTTPVVTDNCSGVGAAICTPPSGSSFPKGTTTVSCKATDETGNTASCSFTVTVNDTQAPSIICPENQTRVLANLTDPSVVVNYRPPTVNDNCAGTTVVCNPPSGSAFPLGTTTVICTATDAAGNQASCSFTVTVFDVCLQDDSNTTTVLLLNSVTGAYLFCCDGTSFSGTGTVQKFGSTLTLRHNTADRRVSAKLEGALNRGTASLQSPVGTVRCTITDSDTRNNKCACQ